MKQMKNNEISNLTKKKKNTTRKMNKSQMIDSTRLRMKNMKNMKLKTSTINIKKSDILY